MKKLSPEEILNLTTKQAWDIAESFGKFLENNTENVLYEFEDVLEYERSSILVALLMLLRENTHDREFVKVLSNNIVILFTSFIPSPKAYNEILDSKENLEKIYKQMKSI